MCEARLIRSTGNVAKSIATLPVAWATTRSRFGKTTIDGSEIRLWPAAALAFHYGARAVKGRLAGYEAQIQGVTA